MSRAFVFPGQGAQTIGMGRALAEAFPAARAVFDEVDAALGEKLSSLIWEGDIAELTLTQNAQPAPMATSLAAVRALEAEGISVASLAPGGPAEAAGMRNGDRILSVEGTAISELADFWRAIWAMGPAGVNIHLQVGRGKMRRDVTITSADRVQFLKRPRLH